TATYDGLSLAWSIAEYLGNLTKSYTLFATHYLELTQLPELHSNIKNYHVSAIDNGDSIIFTHLIEDGAANKSYGLHVAELAGIKPEILYNAKLKLKELEQIEENIDDKSNLNMSNSFTKKLKELDVSNMTPMQALEWIHKMQKEIN